jgi:hypothetical protein
VVWWKVLSSPERKPEIQKKLIDGVHAEVGLRSIDELAAKRDEILLGLIELRKNVAKTNHKQSWSSASAENLRPVQQKRPPRYSPWRLLVCAGKTDTARGRIGTGVTDTAHPSKKTARFEIILVE